MNPVIFSALAEPNRFHIVELLRDRPRPVGELVDTLHIRQPQVSKHLKVLADAGIVEVHPKANQRIYELSPKKFQEIDVWLGKYRKLWEERFDRLDAFLQKEKQKAMKKMVDTQREFIIVREFDAPREIVYSAWTDPKKIEQWWGPTGVFTPVCEVDAKPGGRMYIVMEAGEELGQAKGMQWPMEGEFVQLDEPKKIVFNAKAITAGKVVFEHQTTVTFDEENEKTTMKVHVVVTKVLPGSEFAIPGMEQGWNSQFDKLVEFIKKD